MKALYISNYRDGTGWSQAAIDYILSLDAAGVDVVCRPIKLNDANHPIPARILELEARSSSGCDVVLQHALPHLFDYNGKFKKNVGMYATETSDFRSSSWAERINCMDHAVVFNRQSKAASIKSGVTVPISVIPHACDVSRFQRAYPEFEQLKPYKDRGEFLFYTVGEMTRRKNLAALVKAFHLEFHPDEQVGLVIKTSRPGTSPDECKQRVIEFCTEIKRGMKLHGGDPSECKQEIVITDRLTDQGMLRLHATCDVFVQPSYGEAWSIPAFDAMAMGKTPIVTECTGYKDYVSDEEGWLVPYHSEPVFGVNDTFDDLFVGTETWSAVDISHLRACMREAFEDSRLREEKAAKGIERAYDFSYEAVGPLLRKALSDEEGISV